MAIAQTDTQRTSPPYALIVFAFLTVVLAAGAVWLYLKWDKSKKELANLQSQQDSLLTKAQSRDKAYQDVMAEALKAKGSPSVVAYLLEERSKLRSQLVSEPNLSSADIQEKIDAAIKTAQASLAKTTPASLAGLPLVEVIKTLAGACESQRQAWIDLNGALSAAQALAQSAQERARQIQTSSEASITQIRAEVQARRNKLDRDLKEWNSHLEKIQADLKNLSQTLRTEKNVAQQKLEVLQKDLGDNKKRLASLIDKVQQWRAEGGIDFTGMVSKADGKIITVIPEQDIVLIDIGQGEHLPLSVQFEVFTSGERITEQTKSKATIQVVRVREGLSECQIVRLAKNQVLLPGDLIVNSVYDRQNKYVFRIIGEFDIDGSGTPDIGGTKNLEGLIQRWGGQVVNNLQVQTDFLVVGLEPQVPEEPDRFDEAAVALYEQKRKEREAYLQEQSRAMSLSIPILNHRRFLYLLGLGDRSELEPMSELKIYP
ncbi:MAG: hypothetical protein GWP14_06655 [Actinobacteria bacterium]|nr:hypothetical protein [Actinomycetota bacterium]